MIFARPGTNGNTPEDFRKAALTLNDAAFDLKAKLGHIRAELFHGRNYQHEENPDIRLADVCKVEIAMRTVKDLEKLAVDLLDASRP